MKPLTIDELRSLQVGDWVWITQYGSGMYFQKDRRFDDEFATTSQHFTFYYANYGKTWLAYKNKEQAEAKGEIVEFPCLRKVTHCAHSLNGSDTAWRVYLICNKPDEPYFNAIDFEERKTKEEAESRLKELQIR